MTGNVDAASVMAFQWNHDAIAATPLRHADDVCRDGTHRSGQLEGL